MDVPDTARTGAAETGNRGRKRKETRESWGIVLRNTRNNNKMMCKVCLCAQPAAAQRRSFPLGPGRRLSSKGSRAAQGLSSQSLAVAFAQGKHGGVSARGGKDEDGRLDAYQFGEKSRRYRGDYLIVLLDGGCVSARPARRRRRRQEGEQATIIDRQCCRERTMPAAFKST